MRATGHVCLRTLLACMGHGFAVELEPANQLDRIERRIADRLRAAMLTRSAIEGLPDSPRELAAIDELWTDYEQCAALRLQAPRRTAA